MNKLLVSLMISFVSFNAFAANDFGGPYIGAQLGYVSGKHNETEGSTVGNTTPWWWVDDIKPSGLSYGLYAGFNQVLPYNILVGIEADVDGLDASAKKDGHWLGRINDGYPIKVDYQYAASLRGRIGYIFNQDSTLLFVTAGGALASLKADFFNQPGTTLTDSNTTTITGWTVGLGAEQLLTNSISIKAEYRYTDFGSYRILNTNYCGTLNCYDQIESKFDAIRFGVHYKF